MATMYRHGDVLLIRRGDAPQPTDQQPERSHVLAEGEVTGHAHRVYGDGATYGAPSLLDSVLDRTTNVLLLDRVLALPAGGRIEHEEHRRIDLPPGVYEVRIQRTLTQRGQWSQVAD